MMQSQWLLAGRPESQSNQQSPHQTQAVQLYPFHAVQMFQWKLVLNWLQQTYIQRDGLKCVSVHSDIISNIIHFGVKQSLYKHTHV